MTGKEAVRGECTAALCCSLACQKFNFTPCIPLLLGCSSSLTCSSLALWASFLPRLSQECSQIPNSSLFTEAFSPLNSLFGHEFIFPLALHFKNRHGKMKSGDNVQCCVMRAPALRYFWIFLEVPNKFCSVKMSRNQFKEKGRVSQWVTALYVLKMSIKWAAPPNLYPLGRTELISSLGLCTSLGEKVPVFH